MTKILVVDDSTMVRRQVAQALTTAGYEVSEAGDGVEAIELADAEVALVVCDVTMPRMNGIELLVHLRRDARTVAVPVIMLTTEGRPDLIAQARALGAKGWLIKPFKPPVLLAAVSALLRRE